MASSVQKQILDAVMAALTAPGAPAPANRARTESFSTEQMPAYNVYPIRGAPFDAEDTATTVAQRFSFAVVPMATAASEVDVTLDPLFVWACQQILRDPTLGGLVLTTELESWEWAFPPADSDVSSCQMTFTALLSVLRGDPTASGLTQ